MGLSLSASNLPEFSEWSGIGEEEGGEAQLADVLAFHEPFSCERLTLWGHSGDITALPYLHSFAALDSSAASAHSGTPEAVGQRAMSYPERECLAHLPLETRSFGLAASDAHHTLLGKRSGLNRTGPRAP